MFLLIYFNLTYRALAKGLVSGVCPWGIPA